MNTRLLPRIFLAALLATVISLGAPQAFAGEEEDAASSEAADKADDAADKADDAWDEYEKQKADAKDDGKTDKEAEEAAAEAKKAAEKAEADAKKAEDASKAADEKAKKADDKEIENRKDKKDKDDIRKNRHKKRAERRQKRAHLRKLKAELRERTREGGVSSKTKELEKKIKDLEKGLGIQPPPKQPPPTPGPERSLLGQVIASGKASASIAGTGETIGHVADLKIQNLTDQPLTCAIPPMILESASRKNQDYACPRGQTIALNPQQTKTVPMNGVCLNRNKPPVGKGVSGDLVINEANPNVPQDPNLRVSATDANRLLQICTSKYDAADALQKEGALKDLPYKGKQKQKDIVVQWSTWTDPVICQMTGSPPATKEDLRKVVYKQVEEQGPMTPETKKKVDKGIDTIFEKVELTSAKAKDLEKPGPFFGGLISAEKAGPLFKPAPGAQLATVAQPGDIVHVEGTPSGGGEGDKRVWIVKVKLPSGEIVTVRFETADKPKLKFCDWIKINKTHTDPGGNTVIDDYEKTTAPTPTPPPTPTPTPTATPTATPPPTPTPTPQPPGGKTEPRSPGAKTEPEKPKGEAVKPAEPWAPPDLPDWLKPWWEAVKYVVPGSEFAGAVPGGKSALGLIIARLNKKIIDEMAKGHDKEAEFYEQLKKKLQKIYYRMPDEK